MSFLRLLGFSALSVAALMRPALAADASARLLQSVSAGAPFLMHIRSATELRENWVRSPQAQLLAEPEVQAFIAPTLALLNSPEAQEGYAKFAQATGLTMREFLGLFPGELVIAVNVSPGAEGMPEPHIVFGGELGANRARLESALKQAGESKEAADLGTVVREEFQGETIHVAIARNSGDATPKETVAWALVDDVVWFGYPKAAVQGIIANFKRGGATEPITASAGFGPVYQRNPDAQAAYYLDLERLVQIGMTVYQARAAAKQLAANAEQGADEAAEGVEEAPAAAPSMFDQMGLTPEVIVHALGLDALRGLYAVSSNDEKGISLTAGLTWTERRGLLRLLAYGDAPAPQPGFVAPDWASVTAMRFNMAEIWEAVKEAARTANPMFEFMLTQQLAGLKQQVGLDLERDFFGSFGDEIVRAYTFPETSEGSPAANEQLWAVSLANAESFGRCLDTIWAMAPMVAQQFVDREYLGHTIRSITMPMPGPAGTNLLSLSYAITPSHFFVGAGGPGMIETAIQRLDGKGESYWSQPAVIAAMKALPPGASSFTYQDVRQMIYSAFVQLADVARKTGGAEVDLEEPALDEEGRPLPERPAAAKPKTGLHMFIDPDALPSRATLMKHVGASFSGIYRDADGIRVHARYTNAP